MKVIRNSFLLVTLAIASACSTFEVEGGGSFTPDAVTGSETVHGSLYGIEWSERTIEKCGQDPLLRVEHHTNVALIIASVATLGLYVPQTVEWWCAAPGGDDEDEEVWDPDADMQTE
ncbi:MAG: hypothetical protein K0U72_06605 [Gammaproteobacteria bacterium]|nr:hypothetical protein [Gammaproteobacteria bacterium]